jgi:DNA polymerase III alpha subunit
VYNREILTKNFPTFHSHPKSFDSASTPEQMARKELELETGYITVTDHGTMAGCRQIYDLTKEKKFSGLKPILGLEAYFRDDACPELAAAGVSRDADGSFKEYFKYGKKDLKYNHVTLHCLNEDAYFALTKQISQAPLEKHGSEVKPIFSWRDLEILGQYDITVGSGCLIGMVSRHLLAHENAKAAVRYYERLRSTFKPGNFYVEVFPHQCDSNWEEGVIVKYEGGSEDRFKVKKKFKTSKGEIHADTLAKAFKKNAEEARKGHIQFLEIMNNRKWEPGNLKPIVDVEYREGFIRNECRPWCPDGDVQGGANVFLIQMAKHYGDPIVISDDSHFASPEEKIIQDIRLGQSGGWKFSKSYHRQTGDMALEVFKAQLGIDEATFDSWVDNNKAWASRFNDFSFSPRRTLPTKFYPQDTFGHLKTLIKKHGRMDWKNPDWCLRLQQEIELLYQNGTVDLLPYFFVLEEVIDRHIRRGELTGPGRGSAAGVLLSYLLNITQVEPLRRQLSLDRFLTPDRIESGKLPDIDTDFGHWDLLVDPNDPQKGWLRDRFGDCYARLSTDVCLHLKQSIRDVFRIKNGRERDPEIEQLCRDIPDPPQGIKDMDFVFGYKDSGGQVPGLIETSPALQQFSQRHPEEWANIQKCLGLSRYPSIHACGFVIADTPIQDFIPTMDMDGVRVTQYDAHSVEAAGGLKMDFLRVNSIRDMGIALRMIQARHRPDVDWESTRSGGEAPVVEIDGHQVPLYRAVPFQGRFYDIWDLPEDPEVFRDICEGRVETVFQLDAIGARRGLRNFRPTPDGKLPIDSIEALSAFTALDRPGGLNAFVTASDGSKHDMLVEFSNRARGLPAAGAFEVLDQLLPETHGILVYQEQLQRIFQEIGSTSGIDANNFRADIGKKKMEKVIKWGEKFLQGAIPRLGEEKARVLWNQMEAWGQYGFNKSHAVCYAINAYVCAWFKHHYPLEWWTSVLQNADRNEVNEDFWPHCGNFIALPDLSTSGPNFEIRGDKIQAPLWLLKGIGDAAHRQLLEIRPFSNIEEFLQKIEAWKKSHPRKLMKKNKDTGEEVETEVPGVTALKKTVIQNLIVTGVANNLFPEKDENGEPASVIDRLTWYCEAVKKVTGKKVEALSSQYNLESAVSNYQLKKQILPAYTEDLMGLCRASNHRLFIDSHGRPTVLHLDAREGREVGFPVITGDEWRILKVLPEPAMQEDQCTVLAYVISQTLKNYIHKESGDTRQMTELLLDADGFRTKVLRFGGKNGLPEALKQPLTGAVISCLLVRRQNQTDQFLLDIIVLAPPLKKKEVENADTEASP